MPDLSSPEDRAAWRRSLRETAAAVSRHFGPVPERVEITAEFVCTCSPGCPPGCPECPACSGRTAEAKEGSEGDEDG